MIWFCVKIAYKTKDNIQIQKKKSLEGYVVAAQVMFWGETAPWLTRGVGGNEVGVLTGTVSSTQIPTGELLVDMHGESAEVQDDEQYGLGCDVAMQEVELGCDVAGTWRLHTGESATAVVWVEYGPGG